MSDAPTIKITRRDADKSWECEHGKLHKFQLGGLSLRMIEVEDVHFHHNSHVLLADYAGEPTPSSPPHEDRVTGLAVIATVLKHAYNNSRDRLLVAGHADTSGQDDYNLKLSQRRSDNVFLVLAGYTERATWAEMCQDKHRVSDYKAILKWVVREWKWEDCDPGPVNDEVTARSRAALKAFHKHYQEELQEDVPQVSEVKKETWAAFFRMYQKSLGFMLQLSDTELEDVRGHLQYVSPGPSHVGCGENFPIDQPSRNNYESALNRRVELMFFDQDEPPSPACHPSPGACDPDVCEIYKLKRYEVEHIPVDPTPLAHVRSLEAHLHLEWKDPAGTAHDFPAGFPIIIEYGDGESESRNLDAGGRLDFPVTRSHESLTLRVDLPDRTYLASAPSGSSDPQPERIVLEADVEARVAEGFRVFLLPQVWSLKETKWEITNANTWNEDSHTFEDLKNPGTRLGTPESPAEMKLDLCWQYLKFLYFDRVIQKKLSIPPVLVEGFLDVDTASGAPDTRSNWSTSPEACQCLPWILRDPPKPDFKILIRLVTAENTFIESTPGASPTRTLKVLADEAARKTPSAERLRYYDLPKIWTSTNQFTRLSKGATQPAEPDLFHRLAERPTSDDKPLMFSLDDLVLTDNHGKAVAWRRPAAWTDADRVAVMRNTFAAGVETAPNGVYKPDPDKPWFSLVPDTDPVPSGATYLLLVSYPYWTRAVIGGGNLYDAFDLRTAELPNQPVGARAAALVVNANAPPAGVGGKPGNQVARPRPTPDLASPGLRGKPPGFCVVQPFYEQEHMAWWLPTTVRATTIGRFDLAVFRCCGVDAGVELAVSLQYFRFLFDFTPTIPPGSDREVSARTTTAQRAEFVQVALREIRKRWNGEDPEFGTPTLIVSDDPAVKLRMRQHWFLQSVPRDFAHYAIDVFKDVRASMGSDRGTGKVSDDDYQPVATGDEKGYFTVAHESGHGWSLDDEYLERIKHFSYYRHSFHSFSPGAIHAIDLRAMMKGNKEQNRGRYFWHVAEWLRDLYGVDFHVKQGSHEYRLPHLVTSPSQTHVNWPVKEQANARTGVSAATNAGKGNFDLFLFPLGADDWSQQKLRAGQRFDALLSVVVKMLFFVDKDDFNKIHDFLESIHSSLQLKFVDRINVKARGTRFTSCWIEISPRYLVKTFTDDDNYLKGLKETDDFKDLKTYMSDNSITSKKVAYEQMVETVRRKEPEHFVVRVHDKWDWPWSDFDIHWKDGTPSSRELRFEYDAPSEFWKSFSEMLGLGRGQLPNASNFAGIARFLDGGSAVDI